MTQRAGDMPIGLLPSFAAYSAPIKPFIRWAGGKSRLLPRVLPHVPDSINEYYEPFLGGGAVFFHLKHRFPAMHAFLRDSNKELIHCYRFVRDRPIELMRWLDHHDKSFGYRARNTISAFVTKMI